MKRVLVLGDLHVGSLYSIMPPRVVVKGPGGGTVLTYNNVQKQLYREWLNMSRNVGHVDLCVVNGDICEGVNKKSSGLGNWTNDLSLQVETAVDLLGMIRADRYAGTQGSYYHAGDNMSTDKLVIQELGGDFDDELAIRVDDVRFHFSHKVGTSSSAWMYRPTPIAREMMLSTLVRDEMGGYDVVVRSHAHYMCYVGFAHTLGVITPCWKTRDPYAKRQTLAYVPHNGYITFDVDGDTYNWGKHVFTLTGSNMINEVIV